MFKIKNIQKAIQEENLQGWLFFNFKHRDKISDKILNISPESMNTRPWFYIIPANGSAEKIMNIMEKDTLKHLPGNNNTYTSQKELYSILRNLKNKNLAAQFSNNLNIISYMDYGTVSNLTNAGFKLFSSETLIQRYLSLLNKKQIIDHEKTAKELYDIVEIIWDKLNAKQNESIYEGDVQNWILKEFEKRDLITDHPPIVAAGLNSSNPHYAPKGRGKKIRKNEIIQLDLWAKNKKQQSIFADISWIGYTAKKIPEEIKKEFQDLCFCRDKTIEYIQQAFNNKQIIKGSDVDEKCRNHLKSKGFYKFIKHRTGHGIDTQNHGSGVNLDSREFPDHRKLLEGSCFSIEPGIYFEKYGMRTEINVYIKNNKAVISGKEIQKDILLLK